MNLNSFDVWDGILPHVVLGIGFKVKRGTGMVPQCPHVFNPFNRDEP